MSLPIKPSVLSSTSTRWLRPLVWILTMGTLTPASIAAELNWSIDDMARIVQPMRHDWKGRIPIIPWDFPELPINDELVRLRETGELRRRIEIAVQRGYLPAVHVGEGQRATPAGAMAMALTLKELGLPVHLLMPQHVGGDKTIWPDDAAWMPPDEKIPFGGKRAWPIFPLADTTAATQSVHAIFQPFKDAGIEVAALWTDYEGLPNPYNGAWYAQQTPQARRHYPDPSVLNDFESFKKYSADLNRKIQRELYLQPLRQLFPHAIWGAYFAHNSSSAHPFVDPNGATTPPVVCEPGTVTMPALYANTRLLPRHINADWVITQPMVDDIYWHIMLRTLCASTVNDTSDSICVPFVSPCVADDRTPRFGSWFISRPRYRELLRHVWLRGADGMAAFNPGPPYCPSPQIVFESMEDAREVFDEMLTFRKFLEQGTPINYTVPAMYDRSPFWSGLKLDDAILVRVVSLDNQPRPVTFATFAGRSVTLTAPAEGAFYLISIDPRSPDGQSIQWVKPFADLKE